MATDQGTGIGALITGVVRGIGRAVREEYGAWQRARVQALAPQADEDLAAIARLAEEGQKRNAAWSQPGPPATPVPPPPLPSVPPAPLAKGPTDRQPPPVPPEAKPEKK